MVLNFRGYTPAFPNEVYTGDQHLDQQQILILRQYVLPTEDQIFDLIRSKAQKLQTRREKRSAVQRDMVSNALLDLPSKIRARIRTTEQGIMEMLRSGMSAPADFTLETAPHYIQIKYGTISSKTLEEGQRKGLIGESQWYVSALAEEAQHDQRQGLQGTLVLLLHEGNLPSQGDVQTLVRHETSDSRTLYVDRIEYSIPETQQILQIVYEGLPNPSAVEEVYNFSQRKLESTAFETLQSLSKELRTSEMLRKRRARKGIPVVRGSGLPRSRGNN